MASGSPAGREPYPLRAFLEKLLLATALTILFVSGYFGVGLSTDPARARSLATPLDARIPFLRETIWTYLYVFPAAFVPTFVVRCTRLYRRTTLAYAFVMLASFAIFVAFPVTSRDLRVASAELDTARFADWAVATLYRIDPPYNLFPSMHLSIAALAAFAAWMADRRYGVMAVIGVVLIGVSISTVKQHFVLDGIGGLFLAVAAWAAFLRPYRSDPGTIRAHSWRGVALYLALLVLGYGGLYISFRMAS